MKELTRTMADREIMLLRKRIKGWLNDASLSVYPDKDGYVLLTMHYLDKETGEKQSLTTSMPKGIEHG